MKAIKISAVLVLTLVVIGTTQGGWDQHEPKLLASDGKRYDTFGKSVCIDGNYAIVGADRFGYAYIFKRSGSSFHQIDSSWSQQAKLTASDSGEYNWFGTSVSISGDYAIVGDQSNGDYGAAYIFEKPSGGWVNATETAKIVASDGSGRGDFGCAVSISGDYAIVGNDNFGNAEGSAYIFKRDGSSWNQEAKLTAYAGLDNNRFGGSVSISGDCAIVGAFQSDVQGWYSGCAYIFEKPSGGWVDTVGATFLMRSGSGLDYDYFGWSVSISGDYAIVGAPQADEMYGLAYIYEKPSGGWIMANYETATLSASNRGYNEGFGMSVSISSNAFGNNCAIVGAALGGEGDGSAYIFKGTGSSWEQQKKLTASDGEVLDFFGWSVSISGNNAIAGAYGDDDNDKNSGSAYVFSNLWSGVLDPDPGSADVYPGVVLSWEPGVNADWHDVYFGTVYDDVNDVTYEPGWYAGTTDGNSWEPNGLEPETTYYWRIDDVDGDDPNHPWKGEVSSFTTMRADCCIKAPQDLVAWWHLDEMAGLTSEDIAADNDGAWVGYPTPASGKVDGALSFDGVDDYVEVPDNISLNFGTGDLSIDAWVKTSSSSGVKVILDKRVGSTTGYLLYLFNGVLSFQLADGTHTGYSSSLFVADGDWHHVAVTLDRDNPEGLLFYDGGVSSAPQNPTGHQGSLTNSADLLIAADCLSGTQRFEGEIDEVELFNRVLYPYEVAAIYQAGSKGKCKPDSYFQRSDVNGDGMVDFQDLAIVASYWLCCYNGP